MIQGNIWLTIIMYLVGSVVLMAVTFAWLTYRLKKKQIDDARAQTNVKTHVKQDPPKNH